jgi:hypothetical protein
MTRKSLVCGVVGVLWAAALLPAGTPAWADTREHPAPVQQTWVWLVGRISTCVNTHAGYYRVLIRRDGIVVDQGPMTYATGSRKYLALIADTGSLTLTDSLQDSIGYEGIPKLVEDSWSSSVVSVELKHLNPRSVKVTAMPDAELMPLPEPLSWLLPFNYVSPSGPERYLTVPLPNIVQPSYSHVRPRGPKIYRVDFSVTGNGPLIRERVTSKGFEESHPTTREVTSTAFDIYFTDLAAADEVAKAFVQLIRLSRTGKNPIGAREPATRPALAMPAGRGSR